MARQKNGTVSFIHLRVHSAYSLLEGALKIPDLVESGRPATKCRLWRLPTATIYLARLSFPKKCVAWAFNLLSAVRLLSNWRTSNKDDQNGQRPWGELILAMGWPIACTYCQGPDRLRQFDGAFQPGVSRQWRHPDTRM